MDGIYQHFRPEEASVIDSLNEAIVRAKDEYRPILTHFLNLCCMFINQVIVYSIALRSRSKWVITSL